METKFTPPPWKKVDTTNGSVVIYKPTYTGATDICRIEGAALDEELRANSNLLFAAADLYAAAELVLGRFNDFGPTGSRIDIPPLRKALTDALKKARGE